MGYTCTERDEHGRIGSLEKGVAQAQARTHDAHTECLEASAQRATSAVYVRARELVQKSARLVRRSTIASPEQRPKLLQRRKDMHGYGHRAMERETGRGAGSPTSSQERGDETDAHPREGKWGRYGSHYLQPFWTARHHAGRSQVALRQRRCPARERATRSWEPGE